MLRNKTISSDDFNFMNVVRASGSRIWDDSGAQFLDFTSGWNVANLGWNNPEIAEAVAEQNKKLPYAHLWNSTDIQDKYAAELLGALPARLSYVARATGGTEANEMAIKTARLFTKREKILGFVGSYHGQTERLLVFNHSDMFAAADFGAMKFPEKQAGVSDEKTLCDFRADLEKHLGAGDVAAIICESGIITGGGCCSVAPAGFMKVLCECAAKHGTLVILDEVGTGFSRLGTLFGMDAEGVAPDIATFAKGIANGQGALGALVTTKEIAEATHLSSILISTFGWAPASVAAASKALEIHVRDKVFEAARQNGEYIAAALNAGLKNNPKFKAVKGAGMVIGVTFKDSETPEKAVKIARENGLYIVAGSATNIQLMPQLNIARAELDEGLEIFLGAIEKAAG
jgi:4-aminobutyrate aminotransferase-like enzyme